MSTTRTQDQIEVERELGVCAAGAQRNERGARVQRSAGGGAAAAGGLALGRPGRAAAPLLVETPADAGRLAAVLVS